MDDLCLLVVRKRCFLQLGEQFNTMHRELLDADGTLNEKTRMSQTYTIYRSLRNAAALRMTHEQLYRTLEKSFVDGYRELLNSTAVPCTAAPCTGTPCSATPSKKRCMHYDRAKPTTRSNIIGFVFTSTLPVEELALNLLHKVSHYNVMPFHHSEVTVCMRRKPAAAAAAAAASICVSSSDKLVNSDNCNPYRIGDDYGYNNSNNRNLYEDWEAQHPSIVLSHRIASDTFVRHIRKNLLLDAPVNIRVSCSVNTFAVTVDKGVYLFNVKLNLLSDEQLRNTFATRKDTRYNTDPDTTECSNNPFDIRQLRCSMLVTHTLLTSGLMLFIKRCMWRFYMLDDHERQLQKLGIPDRPIRVALINWLYSNDLYLGTLSDQTIQRLVENLLYELQLRNNNQPFYDFYTLNRPTVQQLSPKQEYVIHTDENTFRTLQRCMIMHQLGQVSHLFPTSSSSVTSRLVLDEDLEIVV